MTMALIVLFSLHLCRYRYVLLAVLVTTLGHPVEHSDVYVKLHLCKDDTPTNAEVESNIEKINELLNEPSYHVQSFDLTGSIAWAPDDIYAQVFGNECDGRVRGVGFGPTPSMHPTKNAPTIAQVTQLKNQVAFLTKKANRYDNLQERVTQMMQLM
ncbi:hypothetical protein SO802_017810 [Lithocarpus litseifolius]|uniref:Uncharacterized protein n=1 Tax=Lithocarpus litseifolius TaxID=425828 RepID=A0AAW2CLE8_9ROSI